MPALDDDQRSVRKADRQRSVARETAADVADDLRGVARPLVDDALSRLSLMLLAALMVPVGIVIVAIGFAAMALGYNALGAPTGVLASVITIGGLLGILGALFFSFRALYRRMPRRLRAAWATPMLPAPNPDRAPVHTAADAEPSETGTLGGLPPPTPAATLAELDARLAPTPGQRPDR